jgi:hypothetical protein
MPELGRKYTCYSCHTKFYDLGKPVPLCPKCGADQRDADEAPIIPVSRGRARAVVDEPIDDDESTPAPAAEAAEGEEDEGFVADEPEADVDDDDEEEEY